MANAIAFLGLLIGIIGMPLGIFLWLIAKIGRSAKLTEFSKNALTIGFVAFIAGAIASFWASPRETTTKDKGSTTTASIDAPSLPTPSSSVSADGPEADSQAAPTPASTCETGTPTNVEYRVRGSGINIRVGPGTGFDKVINQKATEIMKETHYAQIDSSVTVREVCRSGDWSQIVVITPDWLTESHRGWVNSKFLVPKSEIATSGFSEDDFLFDDNTKKYKDIIIRGVNKIHGDDPRCKEIDPTSAYISGSKGTKSDPVFFVTCGSGAGAVNVFFSKSDVEKGKTFTAPVHVDRAAAVQACEDYAKSQAVHPSTVDFSRFMDLNVYETPNGNTRVSSSFTAKNSFNLETRYNITCLMNSSGLFEANIIESQ